MSNETVVKRNGTTVKRDISKIQKCTEWSVEGLEGVSQSELEADSHIIFVDGMTTKDIQRSLVVTAARKISAKEPNWAYVAARLLLLDTYKEIGIDIVDKKAEYYDFLTYFQKGVSAGKLDEKLIDYFDFAALEAAIEVERDFKFDYLGLSSLVNRYFIRNENDKLIELPQHFFMRVAMGVASSEKSIRRRTERAIQYYGLYSTFKALPSTPTLFNSATVWPQLSSCFLSMCPDDTNGIMECMKENAMYSKFAGGTSVSFTSVRSSGSKIRSTGGKAGGPIPYIKILNDVLNGFDQSGKRKGSGAVYLEPWHSDIEAFLDLRQPGDERLRAHDVFPALWIPDLFMERVKAREKWSLFDPDVAKWLSSSYGEDFERLYVGYEAQGLYVKQIEAFDLWKKIIQRLCEEGVYWPNFKDTFNHRYALKDMGFLNSSNLCTEIGLRTDDKVSSVCNLHSINVGLQEHCLIKDLTVPSSYRWNTKLEKSVRMTIRALDSVITVARIPHEKGAATNALDRPIGLGIMGYAVALQLSGIDWETKEHIQYANELMRQITLTAIDESANMAQELGKFSTFELSTWAKGLLPIDTVTAKNPIEKFGLYTGCDTPFATAEELRAKVAKGMRNSTLTAIAPTASIANIVNTTPCIELPYAIQFEKENLNGQFNAVAPTVLNNPFNTKIKTARSVDQLWNIYAAAARQLWICQSQSLNSYLSEETDGDGQTISNWYFTSWELGVKSNYYLRGLSQSEEKAVSEVPSSIDDVAGVACTIRPGESGFEDCLACQ